MRIIIFLSIFYIASGETLVKVKKNCSFAFKDVTITFDKGTILPFTIGRKEGNKRFLNPLEPFSNLGNVYIQNKDIEEVSVDLEEIDELYFDSEKDIETFIRKVNSRSIKKEKKDFIIFIFLYNLCLKNFYITNEYVEKEIFKYFFSDNRYIKILVSFPNIRDIITFNSPILLGNSLSLDTVIKDRDSMGLDGLNSCKEIELEYLTKSIIYLMNNSVDPYEKMLKVLGYFCSDKLIEIIKYVEKHKSIYFIKGFIEAILSEDTDIVANYLNNIQNPYKVRECLIISYIDIAIKKDGIDRALEIRNDIYNKIDERSFNKFIFQFLPFNHFVKSYQKLISFVLGNYNKKGNEFLESVKEEYGKLMGLSYVDESNQIFKYIMDVYFLINSISYYENNGNEKDLIAFTAINNSLNNKEIFINEILAIKNNSFISDSYFSILSIGTSIEIDLIIFSNLMLNEKFRRLLENVYKTYSNILSYSESLQRDDFIYDLYVKKIACYILLQDREEERPNIELCSESYSKLLSLYPDKVGDVNPYLNRAVNIFNTLNNIEVEKKIKNFMDNK